MDWIASRHRWGKLQRVTAIAAIAALALDSSCGDEEEVTEPVFLVEQTSATQTTLKRADLPAFRNEGPLAAPVTLAGETQTALVSHLPFKLPFTLQLPEHPVLDFSAAVATMGTPEGDFKVEFRVSVGTGGKQERAFRKVLSRRDRNRWRNERVDLSPWASQSVHLSFDVQALTDIDAQNLGTELFPLWGNPVVSDRHRMKKRPNLILISIDCLRPDHMSLYGYHRQTTPAIDAFARGALVFDEAISTSSWTLPTHMSMLTGLMPSFHGVSRSKKLSTSLPYLPELLAPLGYERDAVVSIGYLSTAYGFERGFHTYRYLHQPRAGETVDEALRILDHAGSRSTFLFLHIVDPHWRYLPPNDYVGRFGPTPANPYGLLQRVVDRDPPRNEEEIEQLKRLYDAEIAYVDDELGRFFKALKASSLYKSSLIVLTADHGEAFYEHAHWQHSEALYEEMVRIPLIVKWPGESQTGRVSELVSLLDVLPTIVEAAGTEAPFSQGRSLSLHAEAERPGRGIDPRSISEIPDEGSGTLVSLRRGALKYIAAFSGRKPLTLEEMLREELYDLRQDPQEKVSLDDADRLSEFRAELERYLSAARAFRASGLESEAVELDETTREHLRALGYLR